MNSPTYAPHRPLAVLIALCLILGLLGCDTQDLEWPGEDGTLVQTTPTSANPPPNTSGNTSTANIDPLRIADGAQSRVAVRVPTSNTVALSTAIEDLGDAITQITGAEPGLTVYPSSSPAPDAPIQIEVRIDPDLADPASPVSQQGYLFTQKSDAQNPNRILIEVSAPNDIGAMYGLYSITSLLGVRYHHPEESFFPSNPELLFPLSALPTTYQTPYVEERGFHEHTQHPTPMSDFYLQPREDWKPYVTRYMRWLARNRQNVASWHMLKTVDIDAWENHARATIQSAHDLGIRVGMVTSLVDEQQNNFKYINPNTTDENGDTIPADDQIRSGLSRFHDIGFDFVTIQIGSSEFTKPSDAEVLGWLNTAATHAQTLEPQLGIYAWIHPLCSLKRDDSDAFFYHLPGEADPYIATWVHTTMFYAMNFFAPVYDCEDFTHMEDFMAAEDGERKQVYFPETAWWLGFDNNLPLVLPVTGFTRQWDLSTVMPKYSMNGHVTFTTGREWTYWQYDHFLTQSTWDNSLTWDDYLAWIKPVYGDQGDVATKVLREWTARQRVDFLSDKREIYFYLAGELPFDELGASAGILARRPKIPYRQVLEYNDFLFDRWKTKDLDYLGEMLTAYDTILAQWPAPTEVPSAEAPLEDILNYELHAALQIFVLRIRHAIELYTAVADARVWFQAEQSGAEPDDPRLEAQRTSAAEHLANARDLTNQARTLIGNVETFYRYPDEILIDEKPETLTSYPFGYLTDTHTAYFWTRRDDQLDRFLTDVFSPNNDAWIEEPDVVFTSFSDQITLAEPDSPLASSVLSSFIPQLLLGFSGSLQEANPEDVILAFGQDYNRNLKPDLPTEVDLDVDTTNANLWVTAPTEMTFIVRDFNGETIGNGLVIYGGQFSFAPTLDAFGLFQPQAADLTGEIDPNALAEVVLSFDGIDEEGINNLIKSVFQIPEDQPLPDRLPVRFRLNLSRGE